MRIIKPAAGGFRHRRGGGRFGWVRRDPMVCPTISVEAPAIDAVGLARDDVKEGRTISSGSAGRGAGHPRRYCQLKRPWYARRVGGAAARVGELLCSPITLPRSSRAGPEKGALGPLS